MGNHNVRSIIHDIKDRNIRSAGDRDFRRCRKYAVSTGNAIKTRTRRKHLRYRKSFKDEYRKMRSLLENGLPIVLAFMSPEYDPFQTSRNICDAKRCYSEHCNKKPCGYQKFCRPCKRVESYPCATFCQMCKKKSSDFQYC